MATESKIVEEIWFTCDCGKKQKGYKDEIGEEVECKRCDAVLFVPPRSTCPPPLPKEAVPAIKQKVGSSVRFSCDHCNRRLKGPEEQGGDEIACPGCARCVVIPERSTRERSQPRPRRADSREERNGSSLFLGALKALLSVIFKK
jgi:DNA-directed RNA polymerase subunit RPC12/RpoP